MGERPEGFTIRLATVADARSLAAASARMFIDTFLADNALSNVAAYVAEAYSIERLTAELQHPDMRALLVEHAGEIAAFAQLRRGSVSECVSGPLPVELTRFYVDKTWHGRGVATLLMRSVEETAAEIGARTLWLGVWEHNARAIAYYAKCGFVDVGEQQFWMGPERQSDRVMARSL